MAVTKFVKLKDCATIIAGQSPQSKYYNTTGEGLPFFQGKADFGELYPTVRVYCSKPTKIAEKDDILLSVRAPVGPTNLSPGKVCIGRGLTAIRPDDSLDLKYLLNYFRYFEIQLASQGTGTTFKAITQAVVKNLEIPIPPKDEQRRIVSRIEELFSKLDKGVETLQTTKQQLAVYRQAVLNKAFHTCEQWPQYAFSDLMCEVRNGYGLKPDDRGEHKILKISAVRPLKLDTSESRLNETPFPAKDTIVENDILFTRYNGSREYVGVCAVVPKLEDVYAYPDKLIKCRPKIQSLDHSKYLAYYMSQGDARKYLRSKIKTTSGQNGIAGTDIKKTVVYMPDLQEQSEIVSNIESKLSICDSIERTVDKTLAQADAMRQSILKQAFEGKL